MKPSLSRLEKVSRASAPESAHGIVQLLLVDHRAMRRFMEKIKSSRAKDSEKISAFGKLKKLVRSHVTSEERVLLNVLKDHPRFADMVVEGVEEHRVHETVLAGIAKVTDKLRKIERMKIFCEILEHHLDEEEEDLFKSFKKYAAKSTRKKLGQKFIRARKETDRGLNVGAARLRA